MDGEIQDKPLASPEHFAPLRDDGVPDANQSHDCRSCDAPLLALYCGQCGQKNDDFRRSLFALGKEAFASLTALEHRIWRTWAALLAKPGKVAREYADGRRTHWSSPVRVYIFMSIALFFFMEVTGTMFFALKGEVTPRPGVTKPAAELTADDVNWSVSPRWFPTQAQVQRWNENLDIDLFDAAVSNMGETLRIELGDTLVEPADSTDLSSLENIVEMFEEAPAYLDPESRTDLENLVTGLRTRADNLPASQDRLDLEATIADLERKLASRETVLDTGTGNTESPNGDNAAFGIVLDGEALENPSRLLHDVITNPEIFNGVLNRWLPRIIFLMMPVTMLIGAMFIRGRGNALLYDHLVHATYVHAVAYALLFSGIVLSRLAPGMGGTIALAILIALLVYLPLSLRRMFRRGWIKTIWAAYGVATIHLVIVTLLVSFVVVRSLADHLAATQLA